jgi:hypothetical protein
MPAINVLPALAEETECAGTLKLFDKGELPWNDENLTENCLIF